MIAATQKRPIALMSMCSIPNSAVPPKKATEPTVTRWKIDAKSSAVV